MTIGDKVWSRMVTMCGRRTYYQPNLDKPVTEYNTQEPRQEADLDKANLVSSELPDGRHAPVLDLDFPAHLLPSSTPGKYHLYIDVPMEWKKYKKLLEALYEAGLIEKGWYQLAIRDSRSYVRLPHVKKPEKDKLARISGIGDVGPY